MRNCRCPVGGDLEGWQQQRSLLQAAPMQRLKAKRQQRLQKAAQAMGDHIWKAVSWSPVPVMQMRRVLLPNVLSRDLLACGASQTFATLLWVQHSSRSGMCSGWGTHPVHTGMCRTRDGHVPQSCA